MSLLAIGINHDTASLALRERVAFTPEKIGPALLDACHRAGLDEAVILSTCNRTEIYLSGVNDHEAVLHWLSQFHGIPASELRDCHYYHRNEDAVRHIIRVASGLDSMILGEPQIFGQMKSAFAQAQESGTIAGKLHTAFQHAFRIAKRVRTETAIGASPVSVAYAAVTLSGRIFSSLHDKTALLIGAGKTIELVARHLKEKGVQHIIVANRTLGRAQQLAAACNGEAILLAELPARLADADIVISSTASQLPILGKGAVEAAIRKRKRRPMFMVDIAVPRDIEPQVAELPDVYLYTVDDLRDVIDEGLRNREEAAREADSIIDAGIDEYLAQQRTVDAVEIIKSYRQQAERWRDEELEKSLRQLATGVESEQVVKQLAANLTNKLLHQPTINLKKAGGEGREDIIQWAQELFSLPAASEPGADATEDGDK